MKHRDVGRIIVLIATGMLCGAAYAEDGGAVRDVRESVLEGTWGIGLAAVGRSTVGSGDSAYALRAAALELEIGSCCGAARVLDFDWSHRDDFVEDTGGRDPWDELYCLDLGVRRSGSLTAGLVYNLAAGITTAFEEDPDNSMSAYIGAYGAYAIGRKWMIFAGAFYSRHQEIVTDYDCVPVLGLSWNAGTADGLSVNLGLPSTDVTWHFSESTALALLVEYNTMECGIYRLADDNAARPGGYAALTGADVSLRFDTCILEGMAVSLGLTQSVNREMDLYDNDGNNEETYDVEEQVGFAVSISRSF